MDIFRPSYLKLKSYTIQKISSNKVVIITRAWILKTGRVAILIKVRKIIFQTRIIIKIIN